MTTDPSWLYSTIAQSSAAIVAIVGGFITASVLMLLAEKRTLSNQLSEKKARLRAVKRELEKQKDYKWDEEELIYKKDALLLESEIKNLKYRLNTFSYLPHLRLAAYILMSFAWFSIAFPIVLILHEVFYPEVKQLVFYLFIAGLIAIIAYVALLITELRSNNAKS